MEKRDITGLTFGYAARYRGFRLKGYRVFVLPNEDDDSGRIVATGYDLKHIALQHPELKKMRVVSEEDYYGKTDIRVKGG